MRSVGSDDRVLRSPATPVGLALRAFFVGLQRVRPPRPIHSRGLALAGSLHWLPRDETAGIRWIDDPVAGERHDVEARFSRSLGLPDVLPDVLGLALRVQTAAGAADIELASTGSTVPLRFALLPRRRPSSGPFGILLPYRGEQGGVLLRAHPVGPPLPAGLRALGAALWRDSSWLELAHATPSGAWHPFALLRLRSTDAADTMRADAGRRLIPGARMYPWVSALRQPSYDAVQHGDR